MNDFFKGILFLGLIIYIVSPVDLVPGPIDDILLLLMTIASNKKAITD